MIRILAISRKQQQQHWWQRQRRRCCSNQYNSRKEGRFSVVPEPRPAAKSNNKNIHTVLDLFGPHRRLHISGDWESKGDVIFMIHNHKLQISPDCKITTTTIAAINWWRWRWWWYCKTTTTTTTTITASTILEVNNNSMNTKQLGWKRSMWPEPKRK